MEEWKVYKIGDLGKIVTGKTPRTSIPENYGGNIPFLTPSDDLSGKFSPQTAKTITEEGLNEVKTCLLPSGSICVSCIGSDLGKVVKTTEPLVTNQQFNSIIPNEQNDSDFIYYLMGIVGKELNYLSKTSTAVPIINKSTFSNYSIIIPPKNSQCKISALLSSLDDKIEVNRKINENLEQQAQALFKSWFVDFEPFKDQPFVESELGMIPNGWRAERLGDILEISKKSVNPSKYPDSLFSHYSIPAYDNEMRPESQYGKEILSNKFVVENNTTLFSKLNPRIKRVWFVNDVEENSICSTEFVPYKAKNSALAAYVHSIISSRPFYDYVLSMVNGATGSHQRFHPEETLSYQIPFDERATLKFNELIEPMLSKALQNRKESRRLAELRDALLPKLMSGEIKVEDVTL